MNTSKYMQNAEGFSRNLRDVFHRESILFSEKKKYVTIKETFRMDAQKVCTEREVQDEQTDKKK